MANRPTISNTRLEQSAQEFCANACLLEPSAPVEALAAKTVDEADSVFIAEYGRALVIRDFIRRIRGERRGTTKPSPSRFPLFEHIPLYIVGDRERRVALGKATYADIRRYARLLGKQAKKKDPRITQANKLLKMMRAASKREQGITVGEVLHSRERG